MITILFFASLRETLGVSREQFDCELSPVTDVASLIVALRGRNAAFSEALAPTRNWRVAVNQEMANVNTPIANGDEVAFFPPVTGG
jgi:sulfur-carrier protein